MNKTCFSSYLDNVGRNTLHDRDPQPGKSHWNGVKSPLLTKF